MSAQANPDAKWDGKNYYTVDQLGNKYLWDQATQQWALEQNKNDSYVDENGTEWVFNNSTQKWEASGKTKKTEQKPKQQEPRAPSPDPIPTPSSSSTPLPFATSSSFSDNSKKRKNQNTAVYVEGLPSDVTVSELAAFMKVAGSFKLDIETDKPLIYIYKDEEGRPKGDATVTYLRPESVQQANFLIDGRCFRGLKFPITVKEAQFERKKKRKKDKKKTNVALDPETKKRLWQKQQQDEQRTLGWEEESRRHVIIKNMFSPEESFTDSDFYKDLKEDVRGECEKIGGVESVNIFEFNEDGVVAVAFEESYDAEECIKRMDGRFFGGKKLECHWYDGVTNYDVPESKEMEAKRREAWEKYLEEQDSD